MCLYYFAIGLMVLKIDLFCVLAPVCNANVWETKAGRLRVQGQPGLQLFEIYTSESEILNLPNAGIP